MLKEVQEPVGVARDEDRQVSWDHLTTRGPKMDLMPIRLQVGVTATPFLFLTWQEEGLPNLTSTARAAKSKRDMN